jgi:hypothetical protein
MDKDHKDPAADAVVAVKVMVAEWAVKVAEWVARVAAWAAVWVPAKTEIKE